METLKQGAKKKGLRNNSDCCVAVVVVMMNDDGLQRKMKLLVNEWKSAVKIFLEL